MRTDGVLKGPFRRIKTGRGPANGSSVDDDDDPAHDVQGGALPGPGGRGRGPVRLQAAPAPAVLLQAPAFPPLHGLQAPAPAQLRQAAAAASLLRRQARSSSPGTVQFSFYF